ncbi:MULTISPECIES: PRC-barrel domain-containing protein [Janthinobacterium]|uniref:PRC-barrel domain-containing protein n=1 Tax=Janthinobacterium lividum TaxID=29581 RepID=A0ABU0Y065_9BURK|nr:MULTISPECIES: PRC-barrel domain-containing protein [Janthinobacterium]MDQ4629118.1 PRC-barrel domain-containing protein [Janthinobacterium lividum]MDQ4677358.1 PRC-barrel domain-containing protein [Janthinobacterium lividum]MDQ4688076.1 PRC-barrel domain-containing protein [Janthinobacterium lividum]SDG97903.1 Sporulation protein YlmC, PRC-barrel domain family [Janthinobacterium sp. YR213]
MSYLDRDILGMYRNHDGPGPALMGADTLLGDDVYNHSGEELGDIKEIMLDMRTGQIAYAVLSFGGMLGMGDKLFAVPWERLTLDTVNKRFLLNVDKDLLKEAPGFDKNNWPDMGSDAWNQQMEAFYGSGMRYGSGAMAGSRMPSGSDLRSGASLQSGSEGSLTGTSMSGSRAGTGSSQGDLGSRSALGDDEFDKHGSGRSGRSD